MLFLSSYTNKIDRKLRVSVPAPFRAVLARQEFQGIIAYASLRHPCVEACGMDRFLKLNQQVEAMDPFSPERDAYAAMVFGESVQMAFDGEGRIMLPEALMKAAGLAEQAAFVGKGETFEIWEPRAYADYARRARTLVQKSFFKGGGA